MQSKLLRLPTHISVTPAPTSEDEESDSYWAKGLVIRDLPLLASNFRNEQSLKRLLNRK